MSPSKREIPRPLERSGTQPHTARAPGAAEGEQREEIEGRHQEMADPVVDGEGEVHAALRPEAVPYLLGELPGKWRLEDGVLRRTYRFRSAREATAFAWKVAGLALELGRKPSFEVQERVVELALATPEATGLATQDDARMAEALDLLAGDRA